MFSQSRGYRCEGSHRLFCFYVSVYLLTLVDNIADTTQATGCGRHRKSFLERGTGQQRRQWTNSAGRFRELKKCNIKKGKLAIIEFMYHLAQCARRCYKYSVFQKDEVNFLRLYFLNYTWYVNDLHKI